MFWKNKRSATTSAGHSPSIIAQDLRVLGNLAGDGMVDVAGVIDGNVRAAAFTLRPQGVVNGEIVADTVHIYGRVKGMIRARHVHLHSSSHIEGVVLHESLSIEDGAYIDGKCKRSDKPLEQETPAASVVATAPATASSMPFPTLSLRPEDGLEEMLPITPPQQQSAANAQVSVMKKNIRLITQ